MAKFRHIWRDLNGGLYETERSKPQPRYNAFSEGQNFDLDRIYPRKRAGHPRFTEEPVKDLALTLNFESEVFALLGAQNLGANGGFFLGVAFRFHGQIQDGYSYRILHRPSLNSTLTDELNATIFRSSGVVHMTVQGLVSDGVNYQVINLTCSLGVDFDATTWHRIDIGLENSVFKFWFDGEEKDSRAVPSGYSWHSTTEARDLYLADSAAPIGGELCDFAELRVSLLPITISSPPSWPDGWLTGRVSTLNGHPLSVVPLNDGGGYVLSGGMEGRFSGPPSDTSTGIAFYGGSSLLGFVRTGVELGDKWIIKLTMQSPSAFAGNGGETTILGAGFYGGKGFGLRLGTDLKLYYYNGTSIASMSVSGYAHGSENEIYIKWDGSLISVKAGDGAWNTQSAAIEPETELLLGVWFQDQSAYDSHDEANYNGFVGEIRGLEVYHGTEVQDFVSEHCLIYWDGSREDRSRNHKKGEIVDTETHSYTTPWGTRCVPMWTAAYWKGEFLLPVEIGDRVLVYRPGASWELDGTSFLVHGSATTEWDGENLSHTRYGDRAYFAYGKRIEVLDPEGLRCAGLERIPKKALPSVLSAPLGSGISGWVTYGFRFYNEKEGVYGPLTITDPVKINGGAIIGFDTTVPPCLAATGPKNVSYSWPSTTTGIWTAEGWFKIPDQEADEDDIWISFQSGDGFQTTSDYPFTGEDSFEVRCRVASDYSGTVFQVGTYNSSNTEDYGHLALLVSSGTATLRATFQDSTGALRTGSGETLIGSFAYAGEDIRIVCSPRGDGNPGQEIQVYLDDSLVLTFFTFWHFQQDSVPLFIGGRKSQTGTWDDPGTGKWNYLKIGDFEARAADLEGKALPSTPSMTWVPTSRDPQLEKGAREEVRVLDRDGHPPFAIKVSDQKLRFYLVDSSGREIFLGETYAGPGWTHVALVADEDEITGYKNGVEVFSQDVTKSYLLRDAYGTLRIGDLDYAEVRFWETARTSDEIAENWKKTLVTADHKETGGSGTPIWYQDPLPIGHEAHSHVQVFRSLPTTRENASAGPWYMIGQTRDLCFIDDYPATVTGTQDSPDGPSMEGQAVEQWGPYLAVANRERLYLSEPYYPEALRRIPWRLPGEIIDMVAKEDILFLFLEREIWALSDLATPKLQRLIRGIGMSHAGGAILHMGAVYFWSDKGPARILPSGVEQLWEPVQTTVDTMTKPKAITHAHRVGWIDDGKVLWYYPETGVWSKETHRLNSASENYFGGWGHLHRFASGTHDGPEGSGFVWGDTWGSTWGGRTDGRFTYPDPITTQYDVRGMKIFIQQVSTGSWGVYDIASWNEDTGVVTVDGFVGVSGEEYYYEIGAIDFRMRKGWTDVSTPGRWKDFDRFMVTPEDTDQTYEIRFYVEKQFGDNVEASPVETEESNDRHIYTVLYGGERFDWEICKPDRGNLGLYQALVEGRTYGDVGYDTLQNGSDELPTLSASTTNDPEAMKDGRIGSW